MGETTPGFTFSLTADENRQRLELHRHQDSTDGIGCCRHAPEVRIRLTPRLVWRWICIGFFGCDSDNVLHQILRWIKDLTGSANLGDQVVYRALLHGIRIVPTRIQVRQKQKGQRNRGPTIQGLGHAVEGEDRTAV